MCAIVYGHEYAVFFVPIAVAFILRHVDHPQTILLLKKWLFFFAAHLLPFGTWNKTSNTGLPMITHTHTHTLDVTTDHMGFWLPQQGGSTQHTLPHEYNK